MSIKPKNQLRIHWNTYINSNGVRGIDGADMNIGGIDIIDSMALESDIYKRVDLDTMFDGKEPVLGNPLADGQVLSSTAAGVRSWIDGPIVKWGTIAGTLSTQTDLQSALNSKAPVSHNHDSAYLKLDGSNSMTSDVDMGSNKISNLAPGTVNGDAVSYDQLNFLGLTDSPTDYTDNANKAVAVNMAEDGLAFRSLSKHSSAINDVVFEIGKFVHIATVGQDCSARVHVTFDSGFYEPSVDVVVYNVYDTVRYELTIAHYGLATGNQFNNLIFKQLANGAPIDVFLEISELRPGYEDVGIDVEIDYNSTRGNLVIARGEVVSSVSNRELEVAITSKDFRATNIPYGNLVADTFNGVALTASGSGDDYLAADGAYKAIPASLTTFKDLTDTPAAYTDQAGNKLIVNDAEDGLEFVADIEMGSIEVNYRWRDDITATDPGAGRVKGNNADYSLITEIYISETDRNGKIRDGMLTALDGGDVIIFRDNNSDTKFITSKVTVPGATDNGDWWTIPVTTLKVGPDVFNNGERGIFGAIYLSEKHFIKLHDTPADYAGGAGKVVRVNAAESGVEFDENIPVSTDTIFGGFRHTFDSGTGTLELFTS